MREELHRQILGRFRATMETEVAHDKRAIVLAGPPGAGKSRILGELIGSPAARAGAGGSRSTPTRSRPSSWTRPPPTGLTRRSSPPAVRELEAQGSGSSRSTSPPSCTKSPPNWPRPCAKKRSAPAPTSSSTRSCPSRTPPSSSDTSLSAPATASTSSTSRCPTTSRPPGSPSAGAAPTPRHSRAIRVPPRREMGPRGLRPQRVCRGGVARHFSGVRRTRRARVWQRHELPPVLDTWERPTAGRRGRPGAGSERRPRRPPGSRRHSQRPRQLPGRPAGTSSAPRKTARAVNARALAGATAPTAEPPRLLTGGRPRDLPTVRLGAVSLASVAAALAALAYARSVLGRAAHGAELVIELEGQRPTDHDPALHRSARRPLCHIRSLSTNRAVLVLRTGPQLFAMSCVATPGRGPMQLSELVAPLVSQGPE